MAKIIDIATAIPPYTHKQMDILQFMSSAYGVDETEQRKLRYLYRFSGIDQRHSVIEDYGLPTEQRKFYPHHADEKNFPSVEDRMAIFNQEACKLSLKAIEKLTRENITHLITVSCTGMSAPGLDLQLMEAMNLPHDTERTSVNFMGCYAAVQALKQAAYIANSTANSVVLVVCTELCSLHFQNIYTHDNVASTLLFGDGTAAVLVAPDAHKRDGLQVKSFYSEVQFTGKRDMAWEITSGGFLMTLSGYVPDIIELELLPLFERACAKAGLQRSDIDYWCMHPGGKKILEAIHQSLGLEEEQLRWSKEVLRLNGNMSSVTILFVLASMFDELMAKAQCNVFGAAFGPGLTMESMILSRG